ncbi:hypothetical protein DRE_02821 [Drechslerella stenobrocha 248]|uniref:Uncharacterized protein n=1 Tax=Drechslerella stenobrocha 248 TaxID=1043628 RepID=W7HWL2_9PEZI|nr:hypothetical protein DRE_02821 [Drechslerella stenobrocha 248]
MGIALDSLPDLAGRVYIVTGGNAGIGLETAKVLTQKNARVYIGARSDTKAQTAISTIQSQLPKNCTGTTHYLHLDHMNLSTISAGAQAFLAKETSLHGLILNAGIMCTPYEISPDGHEAHFQTNYLAHFLLTELLLPLMQTTARQDDVAVGSVRLVEVSSAAYIGVGEPGVNFAELDLPRAKPIDRYAQSKLANILHVRELHARVGPKGSQAEKGEIWVAVIHPGLVDTNVAASYASTSLLGRTLLRIGFAAKPEDGASGTIFAAASNSFTREWAGRYIVSPGKKGSLYRQANNVKLQEKLWKWSEEELARLGFLT